MTPRFTLQDLRPSSFGLEDAEGPRQPDAPGSPQPVDGLDRLDFSVPEFYEPNYGYPLLVWLRQADSGLPDLRSLMTGISERNYFGLSIPLPRSSGARRAARLETAVRDAALQLHEEYHIHGERIVPVGLDAGATAALELFLTRPEWFAGVVALGGEWPRSRSPLLQFRTLRGKRALLGPGSTDCATQEMRTLQTARLLHSAGLNVTLLGSTPIWQRLPRVLREIDYWVMATIRRGR